MPYESKDPPVPLSTQDIWGFLFERTDQPFPDNKVILRDAYTDRAYTFSQVRDATVEFGKGLRSVLDWKKNDVLVFFAPNCIDTPAVMWGCLWAGGVVSPANSGGTPDELAFQLQDAGAKVLVTQLSLLGAAVEAARKAGLSADRVILMSDERDPTGRHRHVSDLRDRSSRDTPRPTMSNAENELAYLPYSSGTTGRPKGVMLSHRNITSNILMTHQRDVERLSWQTDKLLACLPFYHIYGLSGMVHQTFYAGYEMVVMPRFDLEDYCRLVQQHKITMAYLVPPIILRLTKDPLVTKYDLSSLKIVTSAAAPLSKELIEAFYARHKTPVKQAYGLTETSPAVYTQPWKTWQTKMGSVGTLMANQTIKYMSPDGDREVPPGEPGELWVQGPNVFMGYLNNAAATRQALTPDGFFKTGDVGYQDAHGNFYITDRIKELIKYKGSQVAPAELEGLLLSHPKINDVGVVGIYHEEQVTELPRAYIVLNPGETADEKTAEEIVQWLAQRVANHKRLRGGVRFLREIPKSASGKILRRVIRDLEAKEAKMKETVGKAKL